MRRAIEKGLEHAPIGIDRRPGTRRPIFISAGWAGAQAPRSGGTAPPPAPTTRSPITLANPGRSSASDRGQPTSWSAAVDALAAGRTFDPATHDLIYLEQADDAARR